MNGRAVLAVDAQALESLVSWNVFSTSCSVARVVTGRGGLRTGREHAAELALNLLSRTVRKEATPFASNKQMCLAGGPVK